MGKIREVFQKMHSAFHMKKLYFQSKKKRIICIFQCKMME